MQVVQNVVKSVAINCFPSSLALLRSAAFLPLTSVRRKYAVVCILLVSFSYCSRIQTTKQNPEFLFSAFYSSGAKFIPEEKYSVLDSPFFRIAPCCCAPAVLPLWFCSLDLSLLYTLSLKHPLLLSGKVPSYSAFTFTHPPHFVPMIRSSSSSLSALFCVPSACASSFHLAFTFSFFPYTHTSFFSLLIYFPFFFY